MKVGKLIYLAIILLASITIALVGGYQIEKLKLESEYHLEKLKLQNASSFELMDAKYETYTNQRVFYLFRESDGAFKRVTLTTFKEDKITGFPQYYSSTIFDLVTGEENTYIPDSLVSSLASYYKNLKTYKVTTITGREYEIDSTKKITTESARKFLENELGLDKGDLLGMIDKVEIEEETSDSEREVTPES